MSADPHLLPDGSTSWGPDTETIESLREQLEIWTREHTAELERADAAEAKLAEEKESHHETIRHYDRFVPTLCERLAEVEKALDSTRHQLYEVEKDRDELKARVKNLARVVVERGTLLGDLRTSMNQARDLAEEGAVTVADLGAVGRLAEIARILSGDE